jgi:hypothetical protein
VCVCDCTPNARCFAFSQVNPVREKKLTNIRTTAADEKVFLQPPKRMTLEDAIGAWAFYTAGLVLHARCPPPAHVVTRFMCRVCWSGRADRDYPNTDQVRDVSHMNERRTVAAGVSAKASQVAMPQVAEEGA